LKLPNFKEQGADSTLHTHRPPPREQKPQSCLSAHFKIMNHSVARVPGPATATRTRADTHHRLRKPPPPPQKAGRQRPHVAALPLPPASPRKRSLTTAGPSFERHAGRFRLRAAGRMAKASPEGLTNQTHKETRNSLLRKVFHGPTPPPPPRNRAQPAPYLFGRCQQRPVRLRPLTGRDPSPPLPATVPPACTHRTAAARAEEETSGPCSSQHALKGANQCSHPGGTTRRTAAPPAVRRPSTASPRAVRPQPRSVQQTEPRPGETAGSKAARSRQHRPAPPPRTQRWRHPEERGGALSACACAVLPTGRPRAGVSG